MKNGFVRGLALFSSCALAAVASAVTVAVPGDAATLSAAVALTNADAVGPNVINISAASMTDTAQIRILTPVTINGDANSDGPCDILVDSVTIEAAADVGRSGKSYIEVDT